MDSAASRAAARSATGPPLHGASGTPARSARSLDSILSPSRRITSADGPMKVMPSRSHSSANSAFSDTKPQPGQTASSGPISTASSAWRTNVACRSAAVYTAMTRSAGRPSAFHSRTALISRMAGSPRLTIATRWKAKSGRLIALLTEGGADVVDGAPGRGRCPGPVRVLQHVQYHLVRDDRRVDAHHRVPADGPGPEPGREHPHRFRDHPVPHGVVDRDGNARCGHVAHPLHVEVQLVGGEPSLAGQVQ